MPNCTTTRDEEDMDCSRPSPFDGGLSSGGRGRGSLHEAEVEGWSEQDGTTICSSSWTDRGAIGVAAQPHLHQPSLGAFMKRAQAGLLALGSSYLPRLPIRGSPRTVAVRLSSPITAAGPRRNCTVFPSRPRGRLRALQQPTGLSHCPASVSSGAAGSLVPSGNALVMGGLSC